MSLVLGINEVYRSEIEAAEKLTNIDGSAIAALIDAEAAKVKSGPKKGMWDPKSSNPGSGAAGLTQFLATTWIGHAENKSHLLNSRAKAMGLVNASNKVVSGKKNDVLELRFDPMLSIISAAEYGVENLQALSKAGALPDDISDDDRARFMYLAHHEGPSGAAGFLKGSKTYTRANLVKQIGAAQADKYISRALGDTSRAYRLWLNEYIDAKITPARFREEELPAPAAATEALPLVTRYVSTEGFEVTAVGRNIYVSIARNGLNMRSGPGTEFSIVRSIPFGARVHLLRRENRWGLIDTQGDGAADGFVHLAFLNEAAPVEIRTGSGISADQVRAFWAERNPRGARLHDRSGNALVDPRLLHASAVATLRLESQSPNHRIEMYGPNGGLRTSGSTSNHGPQPGTERGAAMDIVIIDRSTGRMLTNHPGRAHQNQGTVGGNAPVYQSYYNEVVRAGSQLYRDFAKMARFGGYFASGDNAMDTMHIDMRGEQAQTAGGSLRDGFTRAQMTRWQIPENRPYT